MELWNSSTRIYGRILAGFIWDLYEIINYGCWDRGFSWSTIGPIDLLSQGLLWRVSDVCFWALKKGGPPWRCFQDPRLAINSLKEHSDCPETQEHVFFGWFQAFDLCATCTGYSGPLGMTKLGSDSLNCPGLSLLCQWISATSLSISYIDIYRVFHGYHLICPISIMFIVIYNSWGSQCRHLIQINVYPLAS